MTGFFVVVIFLLLLFFFFWFSRWLYSRPDAECDNCTFNQPLVDRIESSGVILILFLSVFHSILFDSIVYFYYYYFFFFFQKRCGRSESPTGTKEATAVTNHPQSIVVPAVVISLKTHRRRRMKSETVSSLIFHVWAFFFFFYHRDFFGVGK